METKECLPVGPADWLGLSIMFEMPPVEELESLPMCYREKIPAEYIDRLIAGRNALTWDDPASGIIHV